MRATDIIERVDEREANVSTQEQKIKWLSDLDGQVYQEIHSAYENAPASPPAYLGGEEELIIGDPYADEIYSSYLLAQIAKENAEAARYNQHNSVFLSALYQYRNMYNRTHTPRRHGPIKF